MATKLGKQNIRQMDVQKIPNIPRWIKRPYGEVSYYITLPLQDTAVSADICMTVEDLRPSTGPAAMAKMMLNTPFSYVPGGIKRGNIPIHLRKAVQRNSCDETTSRTKSLRNALMKS